MSGKQEDGKAKASASLVDRVGGIRTLATLMPKLTRPILGRRGFAVASVITEWATIVGIELAGSSQPEKLVFPRGERVGGVLHVRVAGGVATELQHLEPQVVERINGHFGYRAVSRLKLVHVEPQVVERINGHFGYRAVSRLKLVHVPPATLTDTKKKAATRASGAVPEEAPPEVRQLEEIEHLELRNALEKLGRAIAARNRR